MGREPLDYENPGRRAEAGPQVRGRTIVAWALLGIAAVCGLAALVWPAHRSELFAAAIAFGATSIVIYFPYTGS